MRKLIPAMSRYKRCLFYLYVYYKYMYALLLIETVLLFIIAEQISKLPSPLKQLWQWQSR